MNSVELGESTPDTNSVPGPKERTFFAVLQTGKRVSIDALNRTIIIEEAGQTASLSASATATSALDAAAFLRLTGATAITSEMAAGPTDAQLKAIGAALGGALRSCIIDSAACHYAGTDGDKGRPLTIQPVKSCDPADPAGQTFVRLALCSARIRVT